MSLLRSYLESNAILSAADLEVAARHQQAQGGSLDTALLELGLLTAAQLDTHLSKACGLPTVPARLLETGPTRPWSLVPRALVDIGWAMPLALEDGHVLVAVHPDLPDARLGQLYRQIRGFMPMVAPECCLAKLAAERSGGIVAPRHAMLLLDMLEALEARDTRNTPPGVPQIAGSHQPTEPLPDLPAPAPAPAPQGPAPQAPLPDPHARPARRGPLADASARRPLDAAPRAPLPDLENSFREPPADSAAATVVLPVAPPDAAESLSATIIRPATTDDPSSSGSYPISAAFNAASSGSFAAAHESGSFPVSSSGSFPDLRSVGAQSSRRSADARAAIPPSERRAAPVPSDTRTTTPAGPATPVPSDTRTTTPAGPASATPVPPDTRITAPGGPSSARGSGPSPAAVAPSPTAPGGPSSARGSGPSPAAVAPTTADPRGRLADTRPLPAAWETRGPLPASPGPADSQTHARDTDPGASLSAPIAHDPGRAERLAERMAPALATLAQARERDRITEAIVQAAIQIAPRVALFGVKREGLRALAAPGSALQLATTVVIPVPEASLLERAVLGQIRLKLLTEPKLAAAVGRPLGIPCLFEPVYAQDRGVLMLYIDRDGGLFDVADHNAARQLCDLARGSLEALLRLMGLAGARSAGLVVDSGLVRVGTGPTREATTAEAKGPTSEATTAAEAKRPASETTAATPREPEPILSVEDRPRPEPEPRERPGRASKRQVIALVNPIRRDSGPNPTREPGQSALTPVPEDSSITRSEHPSGPTPAATEATAPLVTADAPIAAPTAAGPTDSSTPPTTPVPTDSPTAPVPTDSPTAPVPTDSSTTTPTAPAPAPVSVLHVPNLVAPPGARRITGKRGERARSSNEPGLIMPADLRRPDAPTNPPTTLSIPTSLIAPAPLPGAKRRGSKTGLHPVPPRADEITLNMPRLVRSEARSSDPTGLSPIADADAQRGPRVADTATATPSNLSSETAEPATRDTPAAPSDLSPGTAEPAARGTAAAPSDLSPETAQAAASTPAEAAEPAAPPRDLSSETAEPAASATAATTSDLSPETAEPAATTSDLSPETAEPAATTSDLSPETASELTAPAPSATPTSEPAAAITPEPATPVPASQRKTAPLPGADVDAAIEAYLQTPDDPSALARLRAFDIEGLARLAARFPGPIDPGSHSDVRSFPPPSAHGPLLRACVEIGAAITPFILELIDHPRPQIRFYAAFLFQDLRDPRCLPPLAAHAFDPDPDVRLIATRVLESYSRSPGFGPATEIVRAELKARDRDRALLATEAAGTLRDTRAVPVLIDLLSVRDKQLRETALESLCSITAKHHGYRPAKWKSWYAEHGEQTRIEWVLDALRHRDTAVRRWAADELVRITGHRIAPPPDGEKPTAKYVLLQWTAWWEAHAAELASS